VRARNQEIPKKLFIPLPFIPSLQGRGNFTFYEIINFGDFVKSKIY